MGIGVLRLGLWAKYLAGMRLAPFVPTPHHVAMAMLRLANLGADDYLFDLGCGDARLLIAGAKHYGAKGYGVEMDKQLFEEAQRSVDKEGLTHMITVDNKDVMDTPLHDASVVALYLTDSGNAKILPRLRSQLSPAARVVSFCWPFASIPHSQVLTVDGISVYLYRHSDLHSASSNTDNA